MTDIWRQMLEYLFLMFAPLAGTIMLILIGMKLWKNKKAK